MAVSATVSPGKIFSSGEVIRISELNKLGSPTVDISGAVGSLSLAAGSVQNAHVQAAAGIQLDKLASGSSAQVVVANSSGVPTYVALSGDATISDAGALTLAAGVGGDLIPVGSLMVYAGISAPTGWLICDGTEKNSVSDTTLADLYTAIGTRYGGSSASAFNLPDMRGRVAVAADGSAGRMDSNDAAGESGGEELHTLTEAELASHRHSPHESSTGVTGGFVINVSGGSGAGGEGGFAYNGDTGLTGDDTAHNNMQPYQVVDNYIIKT